MNLDTANCTTFDLDTTTSLCYIDLELLTMTTHVTKDMASDGVMNERRRQEASLSENANADLSLGRNYCGDYANGEARGNHLQTIFADDLRQGMENKSFGKGITDIGMKEPSRDLRADGAEETRPAVHPVFNDLHGSIASNQRVGNQRSLALTSPALRRPRCA